MNWKTSCKSAKYLLNVANIVFVSPIVVKTLKPSFKLRPFKQIKQYLMGLFRHSNTFILEFLAKKQSLVPNAGIDNRRVLLVGLPAQTKSLNYPCIPFLSNNWVSKLVQVKSLVNLPNDRHKYLNSLRHVNLNLSKTYLVVVVAIHFTVS